MLNTHRSNIRTIVKGFNNPLSYRTNNKASCAENYGIIRTYII